MKGVKTIKLDYVYDDYNLYKILYGSTLDTRAFEVIGSNIAAEVLHSTYLLSSKLNILELFGGHSEHRDLFLAESKVPNIGYDCLEIQAHAKGVKPHVKIGDARAKFPGNYNFILAFYYSISSTMAEGNALKRKNLVKYFENIHANLERAGGGGHYFNIGDPNTLASTLLELRDEEPESEYPVHPNHPIRKQFGLSPYQPLSLKTSERKVFSRLANTRQDFYDRVRLVSGKTVIAKYSIARPFLLRDWTEPELTDIVQEAGFSNIHYFSNRKDSGMSSSDHYFAPLTVTESDGPTKNGDDDNSIAAYLATDMMVVVPPPKKKRTRK